MVKQTLRVFALLAFVTMCIDLPGQTRELKGIEQAVELQRKGQYAEVIRVISTVDLANVFPRSLRGQILTMLAFDYETIGQWNKARSVFERAILLLQHDNEDSNDYAVALLSLSNLDADEKLFKDAAKLDSKAVKVYSRLGNHIGVAEATAALANKEIAQGHWRAAARDIAVSEETCDEFPLEMNNDVRAEISTLKGSMYERHGDFERAIDALKMAVEFRTKSHGEHHLASGLAYIQLGEVEGRNRETLAALHDLNRGLEIVRSTAGEHSPRYLEASIAYAEVLHQAGCNSEASRLRLNARAELLLISKGECATCRVSAAGLR